MFKNMLVSSFEEIFTSPAQQPLLSFQDILASNGWTWVCDEKGVFTECSLEVNEILGIPAQEFLGKKLAGFALPLQSARSLAFALGQGNLPFGLRLDYCTRFGAPVPVFLQIFPTHSPSGDLIGLYGFAQGLQQSTEQVQADTRSQAELIRHASAIIRDMLGELRRDSTGIASSSLSRIIVRRDERQGVVPAIGTRASTRVNRPANQDLPADVLVEHRLEWGQKFDFTVEEALFIRNNLVRSPGLPGRAKTLIAPKKVLQCSYQWVSVVLKTDGQRVYVWVDYPHIKASTARVYLEEFVQNPGLIAADIDRAVNNPWSINNSYKLGVDYLKAPRARSNGKPA